MSNPDPRPGPPKPGEQLESAAVSAVTPSDVADAIAEMLEKLDEVNDQISASDDSSSVSPERLAALERQADLLERAHCVLADALAAIDHA